MEEAERADELSEVRREEERVEERSAVFRKELGLTDLVLTQIVFVVGTIWVGTAAKLGNEQLFFWLLAILTFYLPLAAVASGTGSSFDTQEFRTVTLPWPKNGSQTVGKTRHWYRAR